MAHELIHLSTRNPAIRVLMILFLIAAAIWSYFVLSWYLGNMFAENLGPGDQELETAQMAVSFAPKDPFAHWRLAVASQSKLPFNKIDQAIVDYEKAVSLSPNDYRFWTALGVAYEQAGDADKGEVALKRAVSLAPAYAQPHWFLGNLLLRRARYDEAFSELRLASEANDALRPQEFNMLWAIYGDDFDMMSKVLGNPVRRAEFSHYLVRQKRFDEGLRLWSTLSPADKSANKLVADSMVALLLTSQRYYDAMAVFNDIAPTPQSRAAMDRMINGGFEDVTDYGSDMVFAWQVMNAAQTQVGVDTSTAHAGGRSLRLIFQVRTKLDVVSAKQLVPVSPDTQYDLEFYRKSEKLESGSTPVIEVKNPVGGAVLTASDGAANGDSDWQRVNLTFKTPPKTQAVFVNIHRPPCPETDLCPIFGTVWYDDFTFKRRN